MAIVLSDGRRVALWHKEEPAEPDSEPLDLDEAIALAIKRIPDAYGPPPVRKWLRTHAEYLQTNVWHLTRQRALLRNGGCCMRCYGEGGPFHVHHLTYDRLGHEDHGDLQVVCGSCHATLHGKGGKP